MPSFEEPLGWLVQALDSSEEMEVPSPDAGAWFAVPQPGEIRAARPMDEIPEASPRLVVVLDVDVEGDPWVNALLIADTVDVATDHDIRLDPGDTGLSFPVLVETDIVGPLFVVQLGPALATLSPTLLQGLRAEVCGDTLPNFAGRRGLPLRSNREARWQWKEHELAAMHEMAYPCMELELREDSGVTFVDPVLTKGIGEEEPHDIAGLVLKLLTAGPEGRPGAVSMVPEGIHSEEGLASWITHLSPDLARAIEPALTGALSAPVVEGPMLEAHWDPAWRSEGMDALSTAIGERARRGLRATRVVTRRSDWPDVQGGEAVALYIAGVGLVQVKPEFIETEAA